MCRKPLHCTEGMWGLRAVQCNSVKERTTQRHRTEEGTCGCQSVTSMPRQSKPTMPIYLPSSSEVYAALRMSFALVFTSFSISCTFRCAGILLSLCHRRAKLAEPLLPGSSSSCVDVTSTPLRSSSPVLFFTWNHMLRGDGVHSCASGRLAACFVTAGSLSLPI